MGTAVMGRDPQNSVTDEWGRCHELNNLPHSTLKCNTSGGGDRFSCRMMLRIGQEAATVLVTKQERLPCPRAIAT